MRSPVTHAIAGVIACVFALQLLWGNSDATLQRMGANLAARVADQPWRVLSSAFLHAGVVHILANVMALLALGRFLEHVIGSARFLVLYACAAAAGGVASALLTNARLSVGASGAVWGLLGAQLVLVLRHSREMPEAVRREARRGATTPLLLNLAISFIPGIDLWAHLGGGAAGAVLAATGMLDPRPAHVRDGVLVRVLAVACGAALVGALLWGWTVEKPWLPPDPMRVLEAS